MEGDPRAIEIFVDGSRFVRKGRKSGYAGYVLRPDGSPEEEIVFRGFERSTDNHALQRWSGYAKSVQACLRSGSSVILVM
jgi:hypothetical protein